MTMKYYVCTTNHRKNAKRHIFEKCDSFLSAVNAAARINPDLYHVEIVSGDWKYYHHISYSTMCLLREK